jgi:hypothetical protein
MFFCYHLKNRFQKRPEDSSRGGYNKRPEQGERRPFGERAAPPQSRSDNADSWRRREDQTEQQGDERRPAAGRSYREERQAPAGEQTRGDGWTQVKGKK